MKIAIHAKSHDVFAAFLAMTLQQAKHGVVMQSRDSWAGPVPGADLVVSHGIRSPIINAYNVPLFIIESGYLKRVNTIAERQSGHWQLSYARLNGLPDFACPSDRFDSLQLPIKPTGGDKDGYVLVLGQVPTDSALNGTDHKQWLLDQIAKYEADGHTVRYRKHPRGGLDLPGYPSIDGSLADALKGARLVVAYNSTSGFEVILSGVPIVCDDCAPYAELSGERLPSMRARKAFFARAAYGQWRVDETDKAVQFLLDEWLPRCRQ